MPELNQGLGDTFYKYSFAYSKQATLPKRGSVEAYNVQGIVHTKNGKYNLAVADFRKAIKIDPDYVGTYCNIGIVYNSKGEYDRAIENYTKAIQLKPIMSRLITIAASFIEKKMNLTLP